ncbi:MAG TPA: FG-GAP-like repeat-containing protein [Acidimicrobiales bacterium]|nr:FG-GAP-like repeat-containing protein [Acidimicrobiales bacterium]
MQQPSPHTRRALVALVAGITLAGLAPLAPIAATQHGGPTLRWERTIGLVRESSPGVADLDGDGRPDIVVGSHDGRVNALRASDGGLTPGWPQPTGHPINSSAALVDTTRNGRPEVHIGSGTDGTSGGGLFSFRADGHVRWRYSASDRVFPSPSIHSTPALGDVTGDGQLDAVVGSLGLESVHAVDLHGVRLPGFPFYTDDTVFSSPALIDITGNGRNDIVIGADSSPGPGAHIDHQGGHLWALTGAGGEIWRFRVDDIIRGAPSIGDIDGDGRPDIVFGGGDYWGGADSVKVWALELDGQLKPGWPKVTDGVTNASPTLADLTGDGRLDVAIGTFGSSHGRGAGGSVYAWNGAGQALPGYPRASGGGVVLGQIATADLNGDGAQDLLVPTGGAVFAYTGRGGHRLFALAEGHGIGFQNTPLVADLDGNGHLDIVVAGFRSGDGVVQRYELPAAGEVGRLAWPQFRRNAARTGTILTLAEARTTTAACPPGEVPPGGFTDVDPGNVHRHAIDCIKWWGVTEGQGPGIYGPANLVPRGQMATFIARTILESGGTLPENPEDHFTDDDGHPHEHNINRLAEVGIVTGGNDGRYRPDDRVSRAQMATFLVRAHDHRAGRALPTSSIDYFADDDGDTHEASINKAAAAGLTGGTGDGRFRPAASAPRDQMASFLARLLDLLVVEAGASPPA